MRRTLWVAAILGAALYLYEAARPHVHPIKQADAVRIAALSTEQPRAADPTAAAPARVAPAPQMSCHELFNGVPNDHASFYIVKGKDLVRDDSERSGILSTAGKMLFLSRTSDEKGQEDSFSTHVLKGHILVRTIYRRRPGQKLVEADRETYDFQKQTIASLLDKEDSCHHDAFKGDEEG